jgi:FMNH2-dependent dimethyl sulfone monooxygenase
LGREIKTVINPFVVCRDTPQEANEYLEAILSHRPPPTDTSFARGAYDSDAHAWRGRADARHKQGHNLGGNIEIIGSPEQVVETLAKLKATGIDGVQLGFYDFTADLDHFGARVLPLLKQAGLRL